METAGARLKSHREKKNKSLRDIADATKISIAALQAIEGDRREFLPPPSYVRGFIRVYARELELNPDEVLELYEQEVLHGQRWGAQRELVTPGRPLTRRLALAGAIVLCIVLAAAWLSSLKERAPALIKQGIPEAPQTTTTLPAAAEQPDTGPATPVAAEPPEAVTEPARALPVEAALAGALSEPGAEANKDLFTVRFAARELTWMKLAADDRLPFEIMLRPGESYTQRASALLQVRIGNPGGLSVFFNEQPVELSGERGRPVDIRFPQ